MADGRIAVVTGASRGAGKAIALELGRAGWTVVGTARSTRQSPSSEGVSGTIEETAEAVTAAGGTGVAIRCDHSREADLVLLAERLRGEFGHVDLLVNSAWGGYEQHDLEGFGRPFWDQPTHHWDRMFTSGVRPTLLTSARLATLLMAAEHGCIINIVSWLQGEYLGNLYYDTAKSAIIRMTEGMAKELRPHRVGALVLVPGFMRTERVMTSHATHPFDLSSTESPSYLGRAVVALAGDPDVLAKSGQLLYVGDLAKVYGFTDVDGTQPPVFRTGDLEKAYDVAETLPAPRDGHA
ncbi:MAG: SDR family NAD(P)-dependent oxidoreductase [Thermoplasmata archaeon]|jgi:NAD(P)-dependent dehydrogenase (short-subunit alcohol dehydrogenase family)|nr:SDR family NAD(P)-dependent oxidoreductase [Thermoplasmata archaeon]